MQTRPRNTSSGRPNRTGGEAIIETELTNEYSQHRQPVPPIVFYRENQTLQKDGAEGGT